MTQNVDRYNVMARVFHWAIALFVLGLLVVGFFMTQMDYAPQKIEIYNLHKSFGLSVLFLAFLRLAWKFFSKAPPSLSTHKQWEKTLSKTIHIVLYMAIFAFPLSGILMSSAGDFPASFFGLFEIPKLVPKDEAMFTLMRRVHEALAYIVLGCVGLHIMGAMKHHVIDRDDTLTRMGGHPIFAFLGLILILAAGVLILRAPAYPDSAESSSSSVSENDQSSGPNNGSWIVDASNSRIGFTFEQYGQPVSGEFNSYDAYIDFDPEDLRAARVKVVIDPSSISTGSEDRDVQARSDLWFDTATFPEIRFISASFKPVDDDQYWTNGELCIRDTCLPVNFPFTLNITRGEDGSEQAVMSAELSVKRLDFGVGQGQWESAEAIANEVKISLEVTASKP